MRSLVHLLLSIYDKAKENKYVTIAAIVILVACVSLNFNPISYAEDIFKGDDFKKVEKQHKLGTEYKKEVKHATKLKEQYDEKKEQYEKGTYPKNRFNPKQSAKEDMGVAKHKYEDYYLTHAHHLKYEKELPKPKDLKG